MTSFFKKKYILIGIGALVVIGGGIALVNRPKEAPTPVYTVSAQDVKRTVISTGTVTSRTDVSLSFKGSGTLKTLSVKVGDTVKEGQVLAAMDDADAKVSVSQARSQVLSAQASYEKLVNGASGPDIEVSKANVASATTSLANAQTSLVDITASQGVLVQNSKDALAQAKNNLTLITNQHNQLVKNALAVLLNTGLVAVPTISTTVPTPTVSGTYTGSTQGGKYTITTNGGGTYYDVSGLGAASGIVTPNIPLALGSGLYITFSSSNTNGAWSILVPNTSSSSYVVNENAYQTALQNQTQAVSTAQTAVDNANGALQSAMQAADQAIHSAQSAVESAKTALLQANAALALKVTAARSEDIRAAQASIAQAQASFELAQNTLANTVIKAPMAGKVTIVNIKIGEQVVPSKEVIKILDETSLHVESYIPESSIGSVVVGQSIDMTLDALGPDTHLTGKVLSIDPAASVNSGVIEFRVLSSLPVDSRISAGMTANLTITTAEKTNVLVVPNRLIASQGDKESVMVLRGSEGVNVPITTGLVGDNYTEVVIGLNAGDQLLNPAP
ncbi:MAG: efflux RND transporter periplasmic adaptor subunit [Patescibacteria group bacterium]